MSDFPIRKTAELSPDGLHRYDLTRMWSDPADFLQRPLTFIMLNPSTADADLDDPTIRRCMGFARREGWAGIRVVNLYAFRATTPLELHRAADPVGPDNDRWLKRALLRAYNTVTPVVCAWGASLAPEIGKRAEFVHEFGSEVHAQMQSLGVTKSGAPRHPLYLPKDAALTAWPQEIS